VHDPATVHAMVEDYRAGVGIDREHERADRDAGRRIACPLLSPGRPRRPGGAVRRPVAIWRGWADDVRGARIDSGHHMAEEAPEQLAACWGVPRAADPRVALLKELAHPLRLRVIDRLGHVGPASVSALAGELDASMPELSNHLRRLREAGWCAPAATAGMPSTSWGREVDVLLRCSDRLTAPAEPAAGERAVAHVLRPPRRPARACGCTASSASAGRCGRAATAP
jgi:hypothetical protein